MTFDLFTVRSILLPYAFVWEKCSEFQTTFPLEPLGQFCTNFIWSLLRVGERKIAKMVAVRWPRWPPRPYMVKTFKNLLLQNRECLGAEPLQESSGTGGLPTLLKELSYLDIWPFYGKVIGLGGSVGCAIRLETRRSRVQPPPRSATFLRGDWSWNIFYGHSLPSADSRRAVVSFWRKNEHNTG